MMTCAEECEGALHILMGIWVCFLMMSMHHMQIARKTVDEIKAAFIGFFIASHFEVTV